MSPAKAHRLAAADSFCWPKMKLLFLPYYLDRVVVLVDAIVVGSI